ncbi:MAG: hypothetical protein P8Z75_01015 [Gammaproteobacteria bacterium]
MKKNVYLLIFMVFAVVSLAGCPHIAPILNIDNEAIAVKGNYTMKDVEKAIVRAGVKLGWQMHPKEPGRIIGILYLRDHVAKIDIMYDKTKYSIHYLDSKNLQYDGKKNEIHSNYNGWVERLSHNIQAQLSAINI